MARPARPVVRAVQRQSRRVVCCSASPAETENESAVVGRHRDAADELLELATADPVTKMTLIGLCDRWDQIEQTGEGIGTVGQIAPVILNLVQSLAIEADDALDQLIAELSK